MAQPGNAVTKWDTGLSLDVLKYVGMFTNTYDVNNNFFWSQ